MSETTQIYLFEYHFEGAKYQFEIPAGSMQEAIDRVNVLSHRAHYCGELVCKIPARIGWVAKLICFVRNMLFYTRKYP